MKDKRKKMKRKKQHDDSLKAYNEEMLAAMDGFNTPYNGTDVYEDPDRKEVEEPELLSEETE